MLFCSEETTDDAPSLTKALIWGARMKQFFIAIALTVISVSAHAFPINFNVTHGPVCQLVGPCLAEGDLFRDPTGNWQANVNGDGTLSFANPFRISFDGDSQFIEFTVSGLLSPDGSNPPVVDGVVPTGIWYGEFSYVTSSSGGTSTDFDIAFNDGQTFFIDNEDDRFTIGVRQVGGANPIDLIVLGQVTVAAVPVPAAVYLFGSALGFLGWMRRKKA